MPIHPILQEKLSAALAPASHPNRTERDARLPVIPGKVHAVVGMRRAGKTTFLQQLLAERRTKLPPERALLLSFDDDRLADLEVDQLGFLLEEYYRRFPELRGRERVHWFLDEIQFVPRWERFVRRAIDTEQIEVVVSGSSAKMLSREVHTSLRGRGMETVIAPFSFREFLRHRGEEPARAPALWTSAQRSAVERRFREYLVGGGFPEAQGLAAVLRVELLQGYVDTVLFRDVVDRHHVTQVAALRWLVRQCLRNPASAFSVHRMHLDLKAQGHGIAKDAVHAMFDHLQDAFLITAVPLATDSERRRNSNPRKVYPVDPGLIGAFDARAPGGVGHALESVVLNELVRRRFDVGYVRTASGFEVDFLAQPPSGRAELIQVCADPVPARVRERELRALAEAREEWPQAKQRLLVLTRDQVAPIEDKGVLVQPVSEWLLEGVSEGRESGRRSPRLRR